MYRWGRERQTCFKTVIFPDNYFQFWSSRKHVSNKVRKAVKSAFSAFGDSRCGEWMDLAILSTFPYSKLVWPTSHQMTFRQRGKAPLSFFLKPFFRAQHENCPRSSAEITESGSSKQKGHKLFQWVSLYETRYVSSATSLSSGNGEIERCNHA
jgi:hypothetical protein